jgi:hypothetical protein
MASSASPFGAEPVGCLTSAGSFSGKVRHFPIAASYATAIFYGDWVQCVNDGSVAKSAVTTSVPTGLVGVFVGCAYTDPTTNQKTFSQQWPASNAATDAVAYVVDDPFLVFKMQADGTMAATTVFNNASCVSTAGDTNIGRSKNAIDADTAATTNTLPVRVLELINNPEGNDFREVLGTYNPGKHAHLAPLGV